ncbi:hypothetical protein THRCLA_08748 [Thraustotheca clavata]|uniref:Transmembrane protein n=1 Tax=Thraustotheca clavata TaxID=74557 RepID=A0A1V9Z2Y5_9STRA|nr:hypothetical protein THRCLA_08748 [Thraustotheca clavata]
MLEEDNNDVIVVTTPAADAATPGGHHKFSIVSERSPVQDAPRLSLLRPAAPRRAANYVEDPTPLILKACEVPSGRTFHETLKLKKAKDYTVSQFGQIQERVGMSAWTLQFDKEYEPEYLEYAQVSSVLRVRLTFLVGLIFLAALLAYEASQDLFHRRSGIPKNFTQGELDDGNEIVLYVLSFGISVPAFLIGFILTFFRRMYNHIESITFWVFLAVAMTLIIKKPFQEQPGPVLPLMILVIPIFGITRMRFIHSCTLGWTIFFSYLIMQAVSLAWIKNIDYAPGKTWKYDGISDIIYQTINYGIAIIGGMVSHYRQELIRRRNYALKLPFTGLSDEEPLDLFGESYSEQRLLDRFNLSFRNLDVEEYFCRMWYVIDPHPYENPNRGDIHENVSNVLRLATYGVVLSQIVLAVQDVKLLLMKGFQFDYGMAAIFRFAFVIPLYLLCWKFMEMLGKKYFEMYLRKAGPESDNSDYAIDIPKTEKEEKGREVPQKKTVREAIEKHKEGLVTTKGGYVRSAQVFITIIMSIHVGLMLILLLQVGRSYIFTHSSKQKSSVKPNVYFMGFLNALLSYHRSGYKLRFVYSSRISWVLVILFIFFASHNLHFDPWEYLWAEYSCYLVAIQLLGMMISHEEESLRRSFFVLKSMRILEFEKWFAGVLRIQQGVRKFLARRRAKDENQPVVSKPVAPKVVHAQTYMAQASRMGLNAQYVQLAVVLFDVIWTAAH